MDPIETLQSILLEPSRGSKEAMYFADSAPSTMTGSARSSDTIMATRFVCRKEFTQISSEMMSNFFTSSPVEFVEPSSP